jgi:hypothetical protein
MNRSAKNNFVKPLLAGLLALNLFAAFARAAAAVGGLPFYFEENRGQADDPAQFIARGRNYQFLLSPAGAQVVLCKTTATTPATSFGPGTLAAPGGVSTRAVRMQFAGADAHARICGDGALPGKINYLIGGDAAQWHTGVATFSKVRVEDIYPGVNLVYYGSQRQLEYDFTVAPGADPDVIAIHFDGADKIFVNENGELVLTLGKDEIRQPAPVIYQITIGGKSEITGGYKMLDAQTVAFTVGKYDRARPLVIDPVLSYSTYFGGNASDEALAAAVDSNGNVYAAGETFATQFATPGAFQTNFQGGSLTGDAFVAKFDNTGTNLIYLTYLGGNADDAAFGLAADGAGDAFVTGFTDSGNFPVTNALYKTISGTADPKLHLYPVDAFVTELNPGGSNLVYSTYLGGSSSDAGTGVAVDSAGNAYVTGLTYSTNFPTTNALVFQLAGNTNTVMNYLAGSVNAFVAKIGAGGSPLAYSTYFGGTNADQGNSIAVDGAGDACVTGYTDSTNFPTTTNAPFPVLNTFTNGGTANDAFVAKFAPSGRSLIYSTFLGGANDDGGNHIACDSAGNVYVTGYTDSTNFPDTATNVPGLYSFVVTNASGVISATNAFLTKFSSSGAIVYSAVFGGYAGDIGHGVAVDSQGDAFVVGASTSANFPATNVFGLLSTNNSGGNDVFVTAFNPNCTALLYSGYLGGVNDDFGYGVAVDPPGNAYVVGQTYSGNFPTTNALHTALNSAYDSFLAKILLKIPSPVLSITATNNSGANTYTVSWPAVLPYEPELGRLFNLEYNDDLTMTTNWQVVPSAQVPQVFTNGAYTYTFSASFTNLFLRLHALQ